MKIDVLTLFPKMFEGFLSESIIKRALTQNKVDINIHNIRDYTLDPHKKVDDYGFGEVLEWYLCLNQYLMQLMH